MAFTPEVKARLSLDTSPFQRALTSTVAQAGKAGEDIGKKLKRSFGAGDVFKGLMQGIGIGSVGGIADIITRPFELAYERAQNLASVTGRLLGITTKEIAATAAGPNIVRRGMESELKGVTAELAVQQKLVDDLKANPLTYVNPVAFSMLTEAEKELGNLQVRQREVQSSISTFNKQTKKEQAEWSQAESLKSRLHDAEMRDLGELAKLETERLEIAQQLARLYKEGGVGSARDRDLTSRSFAISRQIDLLKKAGEEQQRAQLVSAGRTAAGAPEGRGMSETERIAARAARYERAAEEALLKGDQSGARSNAMRAARDFSRAGARISQAGALIPKETQQSLGGELVKANKTLEDIRKNLEPTAIKTGATGGRQ